MEQLLLPLKFQSYEKKFSQQSDQRANEIANRILESIKEEPEELQQAIVCEIYYLTICEKFDQMPRMLVQGMIVKLIERYIAR
ncbi:MAG: hypothetical protein SWH54_01310 [Thermodesulfobacteriota bacterium]|nr:hypothetical protein [Thermodesulfobacteriota bacterium]